MSVRKLSTLFLLLCFVTIRVSADTSLAKTLQRQDKYKNKEIYFDHESQKNHSLLYMFCQRAAQNMSCTIFREEHYVDKLPRISPCNVTLKVEHPYIRIGDIVRVLPLNPSKAVIFWAGIGAFGSGPFGFGESNSLMYTLVNFDFCEITQTTLKTDTLFPLDTIIPSFYPDGETWVRSTGFAVYDTSCEISFHDFRCGIGFCKVTIDKNTGKVTSGTDFYYTQGPDVVDIVPKNPQNPKDGNFYFDWKDGAIYKLDELNGLLYFPTNDHHKDNWQKFRYSVGDHFVTVCKEIEETKVKCDQIDFNGTIAMHMIFDLQNKSLSPVPYTLRGGGFLLLTTECDALNCTERATNHVYKVDTNKKLNKVMDIDGFKCNINEFTNWPKFFENDQGSLCISLLCYASKKKLPKGIPVWDYPRGDKYIDVYVNTPEDLHVQCLNMSNL